MTQRPKSVTINVVRSGNTQTAEDMATVMRIIADQIDEGYQSGIIGDIVWDLKEQS